MSAFLAFCHHLLVFTLVAALAVEWVLLQQPLNLPNARKLQQVDAVYGICAALVLLVGGLRVMYFEKGAQYYFQSAPFIAKLVLFAVIGLLSILPTVEFLRWRSATRQGQVPEIPASRLKLLQRVLTLELAGVVCMALGAALTARGM